ncbi:energy-coupling factor transporter transmembrane component T family protein [Microbacterium sp. YY-01]|uniref:energy-coupling factor transporter transmembrane component T family protein n=1 Tax=Microbacterium sp. YY-01 TaxID=3421634 RepID=UPI003D182633
MSIMTAPERRIQRRGPIAGRSALAKLAAALLVSVPLVVSIDVLSATVALALEIPILVLSGLTLREFWLRTAVLWFAAPTGALTIALYGETSGTVHFQWLFMQVSDGSLALAAATGVRILAIGLPAICLFATVDPTDLADDLAQRARLPARFVLGALAGMRMLGLLVDDWRALGLARRARGVTDQGRIRRALGMVFALFVLAIRRGSSLATAMEARGFGGTAARTWARPSVWTRADTVLVAIAVLIPTIALTAAVVFGTWNFIIGPSGR